MLGTSNEKGTEVGFPLSKSLVEKSLGDGDRVLFALLLDGFWLWYATLSNAAQVTVGVPVALSGIFISASMVHFTPVFWGSFCNYVIVICANKYPPDFTVIFVP